MIKPELSVIILNYNTKNLLDDCLQSILKIKDELPIEVIVVDNGSDDGSVTLLKNKFKWVKILETGENLGFAKGNNYAKNIVRTEYVLFLNSDTIVPKSTFSKCLKYLKENNLGAITCKILLPDGTVDRDARRAFITPWIGLVHLFLKLDILFPKSKLFAGYWYSYISENKIHEVDAIEGAYFMAPRKVLDAVGWFDEDYFLDAEDIDLCWKIKKLGYKIVYYPEVSITHLKGATKGKHGKNIKDISLREKIKYRLSGVTSMEIFYKKRLWNNYPLLVNYFVIFGIRVLKFIRVIELLIFR